MPTIASDFICAYPLDMKQAPGSTEKLRRPWRSWRPLKTHRTCEDRIALICTTPQPRRPVPSARANHPIASPFQMRTKGPRQIRLMPSDTVRTATTFGRLAINVNSATRKPRVARVARTVMFMLLPSIDESRNLQKYLIIILTKNQL